MWNTSLLTCSLLFYSDGALTETREGPQSEDYGGRQAAVSDWGWKRASVAAERRRAFSSWGGKRAPAFQTWGGKKSGEQGPALTVVDSKRRPAFSSWGGKRDASLNSFGDVRGILAFGILNSAEEPAFRMWDTQTAPRFSILNPKKDTVLGGLGVNSEQALRMLSNPEYPALNILRNNDKARSPVDVIGSKRAFSSWGGKRNADRDGQKRRFSSWGGKRNLISGGIDDVEDPIKRRFSSWGGKRDTTQTEEVGPGNVEQQSSADEESKDTNTEDPLAERYLQLVEQFGRKIKLLHDNNNNEVKVASEDTEAAENVQASEPDEEYQKLAAQNGTESVIRKRSQGSTRVGKALFGPWGGKRTLLLSVLAGMHRDDSSRLFPDMFDKRGSDRRETLGLKKWGSSPPGVIFSSWGGKRSGKVTGRNMPNMPPQGAGRQFRRGADFYSWGGKR